MAVYDSSYQGPTIDRAGLLPAPSDGTVGQFLKKVNSNGTMGWDNIASVTTKLNDVAKTDMTNLLLFFTDQTISVSAWTEGTSYMNYPFYAIISCPGVTANYYPEVIFNPDDATSGYFAPICESVSDGVKIFASDIPTISITIPTIKCTRAG